MRGGIETRGLGIGRIDPTSREPREAEESPFPDEDDRVHPLLHRRQGEVSSAVKDGIGDTDGLPRGWGPSKFESIQWVGGKTTQDVCEMEWNAKVQHKKVHSSKRIPTHTQMTEKLRERKIRFQKPGVSSTTLSELDGWRISITLNMYSGYLSSPEKISPLPFDSGNCNHRQQIPLD